MDCEGCERRVKNAVKSIRGVTSVAVNPKMSKVTVTGHVEPRKVLERVKSTGKAAEMWPYVPYTLATYPTSAAPTTRRHRRASSAAHRRPWPTPRRLRSTT
ncbi:hypothetical protein CFC21_041326 [Triticum aestivum]|uniref:HMA domain-containing protein n=2 Tax=Triticum aestivum TaxID=4565 RepID=A0A3B6FMJ0_WHEAT|nr:hypothetical protein CFC21_041326 [Triticum aestivum]